MDVSSLLQPSPLSLQNHSLLVCSLEDQVIKKKKQTKNHVSAVCPEQVQQRAIMMIKGLKHLLVGKGWRAVSIQPGPDCPRDLIDMYKYMMTDGARLFLQADSGKAVLFFFPVRVAKHWYRLPRERLWSLHPWRYWKSDWTLAMGCYCPWAGLGDFQSFLPSSAILHFSGIFDAAKGETVLWL